MEKIENEQIEQNIHRNHMKYIHRSMKISPVQMTDIHLQKKFVR